MARTRRLARLAAAGFALLLAGGAARAQGVSVFPDPGLTSPRFAFGTGRQIRAGAELSPILPAIPGPPSGWQVLMWSRRHYLHPDRMTVNDPATTDPRFGTARYAFTTRSGRAHLWIYRDHARHRWVYDIYEADGRLTRRGGQDVFLAARPSAGPVRMDRVITYQVDARVTRAFARYDTPAAERRGVVAANTVTGFVVWFVDPRSRRIVSVFLQKTIVRSRPGPVSYRKCVIGPRATVVVANQSQSGDPRLAFRASSGPLQRLDYVLNRMLCPLIAAPLPCRRRGGAVRLTLPASARNFANWYLRSIYIGTETQAADWRPRSTDRAPQGSIGLGVQIAGLRVLRRNAPARYGAMCGGAERPRRGAAQNSGLARVPGR